jgi:hypothetical protein
MIFVDDVFVMVSRDQRARFVGTRTGHRWCHMWSDSKDGGAELDAMALRIGLKVRWRDGDHYDLVPGKRAAAIALGAQEATRGSPAHTAWLGQRRGGRRLRCRRCGHVERLERGQLPPQRCPACGNAPPADPGPGVCFCPGATGERFTHLPGCPAK